MPDYFIDRVIGAVLTVVGLKMAWSQYRHRGNREYRRERMRAALASHWA
jgi:hypothetical protein